MGKELLTVIEQIGRDKGIDSGKIISAVESAVLSAAKKRFGGNENMQVKLDPESGEIEVISLRQVVETVTDPKLEISLKEANEIDSDAELGDEIGSLLEVSDFGRIAAQTAKQIIFQRVREAEWEAVYKEYAGREGELVSGIILGHERRNYIVEVGKTEALLPVSEQAPRENYRRADRVRALLLEVKKSAKGPQVILSRTHPTFVAEMFKLEVPEIAENIVTIRNVVREPGDRTKIAVSSNNNSVDPVGACVGVKGSRVQAVVRELRGEKIDIIAWNSDPRIFIGEALNPAVAEKVGIDEEKKTALVVVSDHQLSLAIGKNGQNVRLAAKLTGWKIDIMSETEYERERAKERAEEIQEAIAQEHRAQAEAQAKEKGREEAELPVASGIEALEGLGDKTAAVLKEHGLDTVEKVASATQEQLTAIPRIGEKTAEKIIASAKARLGSSAENEGDAETQTQEQEQTEEQQA
jgi:transcription termination/antitermination protein NusA